MEETQDQDVGGENKSLNAPTGTDQSATLRTRKSTPLTPPNTNPRGPPNHAMEQGGTCRRPPDTSADTCSTKKRGETSHYAAKERPRPTSMPQPWQPRGNTRERIQIESRTSSREVGSSQHKLSNFSSELSSPIKPKWAGWLQEKTPGTAGGKPMGETNRHTRRQGKRNHQQ